MMNSIFFDNHLSIDIDDFMSSLDYTYLQKMFGQLDINPNNRGFLECGYMPGDRNFHIYFTLYEEAPLGFKKVLGINPLGSKISDTTLYNSDLSNRGLSMFEQTTEEKLVSLRAGKGGPDNNGSYVALEIEASPYIWDDMYKAPLSIARMEKSHIHIYHGGSSIELHQDTPEYGVVTAVRWLFSESDRRFVHGKRSLRDLDRFMRGAIDGSGHMHEMSRPREVLWQSEVKVLPGWAVLINNANPCFFHGTHTVSGTSASLISHYSLLID